MRNTPVNKTDPMVEEEKSMKKMKITAALLALMMLVSSVGFADGENGNQNLEGGQQENTVDNGAETATDPAIKVTVEPDKEVGNKKDVMVEVTGNCGQIKVVEGSDINTVKIGETEVQPTEGNMPSPEDTASVTVNAPSQISDANTGVNAVVQVPVEVSITTGNVEIQDVPDKSGKDANGLNIVQMNGGSTEINAGNITVDTTRNCEGTTNSTYVYGIHDQNLNAGGSMTIHTKDIYVSDEKSDNSYGINNQNQSQHTNSISTGDVTAIGGKSAVGIETGTTNEGTQSTIMVKSVEAEGQKAIGMNINPVSQGSDTVLAEGDVTATGTGESIGAMISGNRNKATATLAVEGDITATGGTSVGLYIDTYSISLSESTAEIYVDGTVSGGDVGIAFTKAKEETDMNGLRLTVWQVKGGEDGNSVAGIGSKANSNDPLQVTPGVSEDQLQMNNAMKSVINYIVKLAESITGRNGSAATEKGRTVLLTKENGTVSVTHGEATDEKDYTYLTAVEDENVTVSFELGDGEVFDGIYYNESGKTEEEKKLLTVGNGLTQVAGALSSYTLKVLSGGGMMLGLAFHKHEYTELVNTVKAPSCTEAGEGVFKCAYCSATANLPIAATGHQEVTDPAVEPTCTKTGLTAGTHCAKCNTVFAKQNVVAAKGHKPGSAVKENEKSGRYDEVIYCTACNMELSRETVRIPSDHKEHLDEDDDDEDTSELKPMPVNPYAIGAYFYVKGILQTNIMIGIQAQSQMTEAVFRSNIPAGWQEAFFLAMSVNGKNDYTRKEGTIVINIPEQYQKAGRKYALLGMDKEGKIKTFTDQDRNQNTFTADLDFEGYQFLLIYKD